MNQAGLRSPRRIHITGVSDVSNFGDALFPLLAAHRLEPLGFSVTPASPTGAASCWPDALRSVPLERLLTGEEATEGLLVGGGHIIVADVPADLFSAFPGYRAESLPSLWLGASLVAALRDVPVAWNAPGVFSRLSGAGRRAAAAAIDLAGYAAVRDEISRDHLGEGSLRRVRIAPDTALGIASLWPRNGLAQAFRDLLARKGMSGEHKLMVVHLRRLEHGDAAFAGIAAQIEAFAVAQGLTPALVAIGPGAGDDHIVRSVSRHLRMPHLMLDDPSSLREIASLLAMGEMYIGCSLHGYIVAAAYGVPAVLIGKPPSRRFRGFLAQFGRPEDHASDWGGGLAKAATRWRDGGAGGIPAGIAEALDQHWAQVAKCLGGAGADAAARLAFLDAYMKLGLHRAGSAWALQPLASREFRIGSPAAAPHRVTANVG